MAIVFLKELDNTRVNLSYNNNVVKFYTDSAIAPINATISIGLNVITLYPDPNGVFTFNFKDFISTLLNTDNFADDLEVDLAVSYVYDWTDKISLTDDVITTINLSNDTIETDTRSITWLSAFVQLRDWKNTYLPDSLLTTDVVILQKKNNTTNLDYHLNFWEGYPFDLTIYGNDNEIELTNLTNGSFDFFQMDKISRFVFSEGLESTSIENNITLQEGFNNLDFDGIFNLALNKITNYCETRPSRPRRWRG